MVLCGERRHHTAYMRRIEKVKFGVPASVALNHDIPATLLVLVLKVNKEGVYKKDILRAPGNQAQVRKLIHIMEHGRLVNIANYSVYTAASVVKKFLAKLPGGIFGPENEQCLFHCLDTADASLRREQISRVVQSLPVPSQHFLVLLFGTFKLIADAADNCGTRMSPESIGVSVAPSLFHTCVHDGQRARLDDVMRFRQASHIVQFITENFGFTNLFSRDNYEYYARITGRTLHADENWRRFSFRHFPDYLVSGKIRALSQPEVVVTPDADATPRNGRELSTALSLDELKHTNQQLADSTKSLSFLGEVHERQTKRMQTRSEWFLSPVLPPRVVDYKSVDAVQGPAQLKEVGVTRRRSWRKHYQRPKSSTSDFSQFDDFLDNDNLPGCSGTVPTLHVSRPDLPDADLSLSTTSPLAAGAMAGATETTCTLPRTRSKRTDSSVELLHIGCERMSDAGSSAQPSPMQRSESPGSPAATDDDEGGTATGGPQVFRF